MFAGAGALIILVIAFLLAITARQAPAAEKDQQTSNLPTAAAPQEPDIASPEVFEDSKTNTVRFVINGKDILTIDAGGIRVNGNIEYTGTAIGANATHGSASGLSDTSNNKPR